MTLFHLQHPAKREFFTWDELACLCRALGFPTDLFQNHMIETMDDIEVAEAGLTLKSINRMVELQLLYKDLHRTFNHHTFDWNACVLMRALYMLGNKCLDFESINYIRVAYAAYEHIDMKGMILDKHTLLRALKMCGRTISPMKLMNRLKHMKSEFEEKGRIQLYEFFNLILWCDLYTTYKPDDVTTTEGKEHDMFRLVDFGRLLSHHDQREVSRLDAQYLREEWDFGRESLGNKEMFKDPPVSTEGRENQYVVTRFQPFGDSALDQDLLRSSREQAYNDKLNYRQLRHEVGQSQKRLYLATAGSVRSRPISAPNLEKYRKEEETRSQLTTSAMAAYETVQRRLHSAPARGPMVTSERPALPEFVRSPKTTAVTPRDLKEVRQKMEDLQFNMNTLDSRCQLQIETEMEFYIPGYKDKLVNKSVEEDPAAEPERKDRKWSSSAVTRLAYPKSNLTPSHGKQCDASPMHLRERFRGWKNTCTKPGYHVVTTSHSHEISEKGRLLAKMDEATLSPVRYMHPEYVVRHNSKADVDTPLNHLARKRILAARKRQLMAANSSIKAGQKVTFDTVIQDIDTEEPNRAAVLRPKVDKMVAKYNVYDSVEGDVRGSEVKDDVTSTCPRGIEEKEAERSLVEQPRHHLADERRQMSPDSPDWPDDVPVPTMTMSGPKLVGVGQIGTISLLESIQESRDLEEKFVETPRKMEMAITEPDVVINLCSNVEQEAELEDLNDAETLELRRKLDMIRMSPADSYTSPRSNFGKRKIRSAPLGHRIGSPVKMSSRNGSPQKNPSRIGSPKKRVNRKQKKQNRNTIDLQTASEHAQSDLLNEKEPKEELTEKEDETSNSYIYDSESISPDCLNKFAGFRGSVTSEEEIQEDEIEVTPLSRMSRMSEDMTLASPDLPEFPVSPLTWMKSNADLGDSVDSKSFRGLHMPVVRLDVSSTISDVSEHRLPSSKSDRIDSIKIYCGDYGNYRDYLSDSGDQRKFSKETRSRLVNRFHNAISPDLKLRLMTGDTSVSVSAV